MPWICGSSAIASNPAIYDLLSDPPLPGIEAVRRIVE